MTAVPRTLAAPPRRDRYVYGVALGAALLLSLVMHGSIFLSLLRGGGERAPTGEDGQEGAGGATVDISVAGPSSPVIVRPTRPAEPAPPPPPTTEPAPVVVPSRPPRPRETPPVEPDPTEARDPHEPAVAPGPPPVDVTPSAPDAREATVGLPATGTGADRTNGGRSPGLPDDALRSLVLGLAGDLPNSIEGQRALLPAATTCEDPVAGTWRAFKYDPGGGDWVRFTLVIHRAPGGALTGTITSRIWGGGPTDRTPPVCTEGLVDVGDYTTRMPAHGHADAQNHITFGSSSYTTVAVHCPALFHSYAPDNFSGTIDPTRQEFQSVNNDGAYDINTPYVFRRTGCVDE